MKSFNRRLTVIIPGYNTREEWWRRCVESVRKACGPEDEIICVDDGSRVKPLFLAEIAQQDSRIRVIYNEINGGPTRVRNSGLEIAQGEYVAFIDSDDEINTETLNHCIDRLVATGSDVAFYGVKTVWPMDGLYKVDIPPDKYWGTLSPADIMIISRMTLFNYAANKVYSRLFLTKNEIYFEPRNLQQVDGRALVFGGEDCVFNLRCIMAGAKWCSLAECGYTYYRPRTSLLSTYKPANSLGTRMVTSVWQEYKTRTPGAKEILGDFGEIDEHALAKMEWKNMWMRGSPIGFRGKIRFLKEHRHIFGKHVCVFLLSQYIFWWARRYLYIRPIRRWHIRRMYPQAAETN